MQICRERFGCLSKLPYSYSWTAAEMGIIHLHSALVGSEMSALAASVTFPKTS